MDDVTMQDRIDALTQLIEWCKPKRLRRLRLALEKRRAELRVRAGQTPCTGGCAYKIQG